MDPPQRKPVSMFIVWKVDLKRITVTKEGKIYICHVVLIFINVICVKCHKDFLNVYLVAGSVGSEKPEVNMTSPFLQRTHSFV